MGRLYTVKGWLEPQAETGDALLQFISEVLTDPLYKDFIGNWTLSRRFGYSEFVFFGATAKYADIVVEDVVQRIVDSQLQVDGYFECEDEEDENHWSLRIVDSVIKKSALPGDR